MAEKKEKEKNEHVQSHIASPTGIANNAAAADNNSKNDYAHGYNNHKKVR